jgi:polysaccharide pyruvyl transferase WcaK-like protein
MSLTSEYKVKIICHFYDELAGLQNDFGADVEICYSYDSSDYFEFFKACDLVVGTRVHAIGAAASLGIPGVFIAHDQRADTVKGFLADIVEPTSSPHELLRRIRVAADEVNERSTKLATHKLATHHDYQTLLMSNAALSNILM